VALFYLVLRALDTVEDDMSFDATEKAEVLRHFHEKLYTPGWTFTRCGEGFEKTLLVEFDRVIDAFLDLKPEYQSVVQDITQRMGEGMAEFLNKKVHSMQDWDRYCYYVAGLVGIGLSKLFSASGLEEEWFGKAEEMANSMGLFLQKTNIVRDYLEDINDNRIFWPAATWTKYASKLEDFKDPQNAKNAVHCLNDLITNALQHLPDCLEYMARLKDQRNFSFCAIPQIMAIGTLAQCYNNHGVFTGVVKMRRGESARILLSVGSGGMPVVYNYMHQYVKTLEAKIRDDDPNAQRTRDIVARCLTHLQAGVTNDAAWSTGDYVAAGVLAASSLWLLNRKIFARL
jgi:farnesyl-diphosphate farnesyltransferase